MENWPEFIKQHFNNDVPFFKFMDATVLHTSPGRAKIKIPLKAEHANTYGIVHGGITAALVDMAAGVALRTLKVRIVTVEISTTYFEPITPDEELIADAQLVRHGKKLLHADVNIFKQENILAARGKCICYVRGEDSAEHYATTKKTKEP